MFLRKLGERIGLGQVNYHFNFSLKNKYLYVQTSKCACTYLKASLSRLELSDEAFFDNSYRYTHSKVVLSDVLQGSPHKPVNRSVFVKPYQLGAELFNQLLADDSLFKFTFVRNPYKRILSAYLDTVKGDRPPFQTLKQDIADIKKCSIEGVNSENVGFLEFLKALNFRAQRAGWRNVDQHYRELSFHISDDIVSYTRIYKVEELSQALAELAKRFRRPLPVANRGSHATDASSKISQYYQQEEECISLVGKLYERDLAKFGYGFPEAE